MANFPARYAGGRWVQWFALENAGEAIIAIPFHLAGLATDTNLRQYQTLAAVLAGGSAEANFTNYVRKVMSQSDFSVVTAPSTGITTVSVVNAPSWTAAGGALNSSFGKWGWFFRKAPGDPDSAIRPAYWHDFTGGTGGTTLTPTVTTIGTANTG